MEKYFGNTHSINFKDIRALHMQRQKTVIYSSNRYSKYIPPNPVQIAVNDVNLKNRRETPPLRRLRQLKLNVCSSSSNNTTTTNTTIFTTTPMKRKQESDEELEVDEDIVPSDYTV